MALDPTALSGEAQEFLTERHLATLTTLRPDGRPHVCAIAFTWNNTTGQALIITRVHSVKVRNVLAHSDNARAVVAQVDGLRWLALEGPAQIIRDSKSVAEAVARYAERYRVPSENPERVVIAIKVDRILGRV
jgi:F420H(2)-dependent biliverdin reductase